jgi:hypothetical protein
VLVASRDITYAIRDGLGWSSGIDLVLGGSTIVASVQGKAQYSRHQERQALLALEPGHALPPYVAEIASLLPKKNIY